MSETLRPKFRSTFPEFDKLDSMGNPEYPDSVVDIWLGVAEEIHCLSQRATLFLAAHFLAVNADPSTRGSVSSTTIATKGDIKREEAGPLEVEYFPTTTGTTTTASSRLNDKNLDRTEYGRIFQMLEQRATAFSARVYG